MKIRVKKINNPIIVHSFDEWKLFSWDALWAYHPCIIDYQGKYYMLYTGKRIGRAINHRIGLATSNNLKDWSKNKENPVFSEGKEDNWDSDFVAHGYVYRENGLFYMLYDGSRKGNWLEEIGLAESTDLIHWKKHPDPVFRVGPVWWEKRHVSRCSVFKTDGLNYFFYAGHDGTRERIGIAKGKTVFSIKRFMKEPVLDVGKQDEWDGKSISDPRIIKDGNTYFMFYSGIDNRGIERIGAATSSDLLRWKKYKGNPILNVSKNNWDKISAARADIKKINGKIYIFYSGRKHYFYDIGMAQIEIK